MTRRPSPGRQWGRYGALACLVVLTAALPVATVGAQNEGPTLTVADATLEPDTETTVRVALNAVPAGLSGFEVRLELQSAGAATISGADYPDRYRPTTDPRIGPEGQSITIEAADLGTEIQPGATDVTLATVTVAGNATGHTTLAVASAQVDDDDGGRVDPTTVAGDVAVGVPTTSTDAVGGGQAPADDTDSPTTDGASATDDTPTSGSGAGFRAVGALIALLATSVLARRR